MALRRGSSGEEVRTLQNQLRDQGFDPGPSDGVFGPSTEAALRAFQESKGLTVDGVYGNQSFNAMQQAYGVSSSGGSGGSGSLNTNADAAVKERFPQHAYLLDADPEVAAIMREAAAAQPPWAPDLLEAKLMNTTWFKTNSDAAREYHHLRYTDPASFRAQLETKYWPMVRMIVGELGYDLEDSYIDYFAHKAFSQGLDERVLRELIVNEVTPLIGATERNTALAAIRLAVQDYGLYGRMDNTTQNYWLAELNSGRQTVENMRLALQQQAGDLMPHLRDRFSQGHTFRQITQPYRDIIEQELELGPNTIDFMGDAKWRHVIDYVDPKDGVHRSMSMQELSRYVRSQDEWWKTRNGRDQSAELSEEILTSFGAVRR